MKNSDDNVLIEVIAVLRSRRQDIRTVKLEDAKILTLQVIRKRRALANSGPPGHRPSIGFVGCFVASTPVMACR
ncbi:MAG TPA: hypothetical protein EYG03_29920 [Planctomycetes bacterium]|nr:hypothetical protein [Fuerstiella sp.]HIK96181.1 hypothetical protein [Planctomycetota bacterium]